MTTEEKPEFTQHFGKFVCIGDEIKTTLPDGSTAIAHIVQDDQSDPPWKSFDHHGIVSDWRDLDSKRPGERILCTDRHKARFYDFAGTIEKAKREWVGSAEPGDTTTPGERAVLAVEQDFKILKAWYNNEWDYVGVVLKILRPDAFSKDNCGSLWGLERNYPGQDNSYLTEVANNLLAEWLGGQANDTA
jgi:hypothetical protein